MQELWFLHSVHCLMLIDIYMKFPKDSLNGFQGIERTPVWQTNSRGKNNMSPNPKGGGGGGGGGRGGGDINPS